MLHYALADGTEGVLVNVPHVLLADEVGAGLFGFQHLVQGGFGQIHLNLAVLQQLGQIVEVLRRNGYRAVFLFLVGDQGAEDLAQNEVGYRLFVGQTFTGGFKVLCNLPVLHQKLSVRCRQAELFLIPGNPGVGQFRQLLTDGFDFLVGGVDGHQVRLPEVPVVVGVFLAPHGGGDAFVRVPPQGFLGHLAAAFQQVDLPVVLVGHGLFHVGEGVHVLDLGAGAEFFTALRAHRNVHVAAQASFLHLAVADADVLHNHLELFHIFPCFGNAADVRLGDDLDQRHAAPVVVHIGVPVFVDQLAGIFLNVNPGDADLPAAFQLDIAVLAQGLVVLADLVGLGQVGVDVVFPVHLGDVVDGAVGGQPRHNGVVHHLPVQLGQGAGQADTDGAAVGVGLSAELGGAAAENFGFGGKLHVGFQTRN